MVFDSGHINFGASNWCSMVFTETQFMRAFVGLRNRLSDQRNGHLFISLNYSTVTDFAKFLGWSTLHPLITAIWYESNCSGTVATKGAK